MLELVRRQINNENSLIINLIILFVLFCAIKSVLDKILDYVADAILDGFEKAYALWYRKAISKDEDHNVIRYLSFSRLKSKRKGRLLKIK